MTDSYKILGISSSASDEEIKKAYRNLCKKYHPDLNPDDTAAEVKFKKVQGAYDQITRQRQGKAPNPLSQQATYRHTATYTGNQNQYNPFQGFDFRYASAASNSNEEDEELRAVRFYLNTQHYHEAIRVLATIEIRTSRWYYYSAIANIGLGNRTLAQEYIFRAVNLEPSNLTYQRLYVQLNSANQYNSFYQNKSAGNRPMPFLNLSKFFFIYMIVQFLLWIFFSR